LRAGGYAIHRLGIADDGYEFRNSQLKTIAKEWLEENKIAYVDDTDKPSGDRQPSA